MSRSRYSDVGMLDGKYYKSFSLPKNPFGLKSVDLLSGVDTIDHVFKLGDRLDHLAAKYLGDDKYWWVIALVNNINYPFSSGGLTPGTELKIPTDVVQVLNKIMR